MSRPPLIACLLAMITGSSLMATTPGNAALAPAMVKPPGTVVLMHGLGLGSWAMKRLEWQLEREGWDVVNVSYPSRSLPLAELGARWLPDLLARSGAGQAERLCFVTHSMGGIVLRTWLDGLDAPPPNLERVVMLAPPNHGTPLVDHIGRWWFFRLFTGKNGRQLGTGPESWPQRLPAWTAPAQLGIIAGDQSLNPLFTHWIGAPNDGKVPISSTRLAGMHAHLVMHCSHTWLQYRRPVIRQISRFLQTGAFDPAGPLVVPEVPAAPKY